LIMSYTILGIAAIGVNTIVKLCAHRLHRWVCLMLPTTENVQKFEILGIFPFTLYRWLMSTCNLFICHYLVCGCYRIVNV
jgi:hypothetical protein